MIAKLIFYDPVNGNITGQGYAADTDENIAKFLAQSYAITVDEFPDPTENIVNLKTLKVEPGTPQGVSKTKGGGSVVQYGGTVKLPGTKSL